MVGQPLASNSRSEEHTSELQSHVNLVCRLLLEKKNRTANRPGSQTFIEQTKRGNQIGEGDRHRFMVPMHSQKRKEALHEPAAPTRFFVNDTATTEIYTLSLHDALPI